MMRVKSGAMALIVMIVFVAGIGGTMAFNLWKTETEKEPAKYRTGEFAGKANPADIRGSYSLADIVAAFDVPLADLAKAFGADGEKDPGAFQVKSLEDMFPADAAGRKIETDSVRLFVALYKGLPITSEPTTGLPSAAVEILLAKAPLDAAGIADVKARAVGAAPGAATGAAPGAASATHTESTTDRTIKGSTTFQNLLDWGVARQDVEKVLNMAMGATGQTVRDFCTAKGIEFGTVKTSLQALVDAKK